MPDYSINIKNKEESLEWILNTKCSVARFGDGEFDIIAGRSIPYQEYDIELAEKMKEILSIQSDESYLVCLPDAFENLERYTKIVRDFWEKHLSQNKAIYQDVCKQQWYGSTFLSRPYMDLEDKSECGKYFEQLKGLWNERDVLIVEGETSRSGVGNDLFDNAHSLKRIICPSKNSYGKIEEIERLIRKYGQGKLVLVMLGPTAKVISYDLSKEGFWVVDLGHIDSEYEWYKMGATTRVKLSTKHTAEHNFDQDITFVDDKKYNSQILVRTVSATTPKWNNSIIYQGKYNSIKVDSKAEMKIGPSVRVNDFFSLEVYPKAKLTIGDCVFFNEHCSLRCTESVSIGRRTMFGDGVRIYDFNHEYSDYQVEWGSFSKAPVVIGKNCWIGANSVILKGSHIGDNVIVGAGCVVRGNIPSNSMVYSKDGLVVKPRRQAKYHCLTLTYSDKIEKIEYLLEHLPEVDFHVAAPCCASEHLRKLCAYENFQLYTNVNDWDVDDMLPMVDIYLDINHFQEYHGILDRVLERNMPVLSFSNVTHGKEKNIKSFDSNSPEDMVREIGHILEKIYK